jgi:hypothetical protein
MCLLPAAFMVLCLAAVDDGAASGSAPQREHSQHQPATIDSRGEQAMGFDQARTTHHFVTRKDGGAIRVVANDGKDTASVAQIRSHLKEIAQAFAAGDFSKPAFIHDKNPPGADAMRRLKSEIRYDYQEIPAGAEVLLLSRDPRAVKAIHDFLTMQIRDHKTGDPMPAGHQH